MEPHLASVKLESMIHGILFGHKISMSDGNEFRVALDNGLLKAICQMLDLRFISGLNASFVAALEKVQLVTFHDDTDV